MPGQPQSGSAPSRVRSLPCSEAYGHIFIFPGDIQEGAKAALPTVMNWDSTSYRTMYFSREVNCHYSVMHENLMDMNRQFLHPHQLGSVRPVLVDWRKGEDWVESSYRLERLSGRPPLGVRLLTKGGFQDAARCGYGSRDDTLMTIKTHYPYQTLEVCCPSSETAAFSVWAVYVPLDRAQRVHRNFGMLMIRKPQPGWLIYLTWPFIRAFTELVFRQNRRMVEAEQRAFEQQGADLGKEIYPPVLSLREVLGRCGAPMNQS